MTLRRQLLLLALLLLLLPVAGWFTAREVQRALAAAEERAAIALAESLARAIERELRPVLADPRGLHVHAAPVPRLIDGFEDDWQPWLDFPQTFRARDAELGFDLHLAEHGRQLYGLVRVADRTAGRSPRPEDELQLAFGDGWVIRITRGLPGGAAVERLASPGGDVPLRAVWQPIPDQGYRVEFAVPLSLIGDRLDVTVLDYGEGLPGSRPAVAAVGGSSGPGRLVLPDRDLSARLAELAGEQLRLWVIDEARWVRGVAGRVNTPAIGLRGWRRTIYDWLSAGRRLGGSRPREPELDLRLAGPEIDRGLAGQAAVRVVAPAESGTGVIAHTAVPLRRDGTVAGLLVVESPGEQLLLSASRAFFGTVVLSTLLALAVAGLLLIYAGWLSLRIRRLRDAAEAVAAGEESELPARNGSDEIGDLARSFARLLDQLGEYNRYLQGLAGRLAHELDTPLTIVRSSLDNLQHERLPDSAAPYLERALEGADRLSGIFRAMREARRLEEAVSRAELETLDLVGLARGCFGAYRDLDPDHDWVCETPDSPRPVAGSGELLAQALDKLVDNARSFAPAAGRITVFVRPRGRGVVLGVANDGPPLPDGMVRHLFDSMVSVREAGEGFHLGLGLHIVRLVARAHGGKVMARNRPDGTGVEIAMWLPRER